MKESYMKGITNHHDPESCLDCQQCSGEALTGEHAGRQLSSEITSIRRLTLSYEGESKIDHTVKVRYERLRRSQRTRACVEALCTGIGRPGKPPTRRQTESGRYNEGENPIVDTDANRESDSVIVPEKQPNKATPVAAEDVEGRPLAERNTGENAIGRAQNRRPMYCRLESVRRRAERTGSRWVTNEGGLEVVGTPQGKGE